MRSGLYAGSCVSEMLVTMVAGSDTTAAAIRFTMLNLMANPRVYQRMKDTVQQTVRNGTVSSPIKQEEAKKIPFIQVRSSPPLFHFTFAMEMG